MSALPDLAASFAAIEQLLDAQPEGVRAEIARGVYAMTPRPRGRHAVTQARLVSALQGSFGGGQGAESSEWLFMVEPEIRSEATFSRLVPDVAAWRRSTTGWPDLDVTPILLVPEWVGEVLSPGTQAFDCGPKKDAYGLMGVAWLWIVDPERRLVETFSNVRGKMVTGPSFSGSDPVSGPPFDGLTQAVSRLFPSS